MTKPPIKRDLTEAQLCVLTEAEREAAEDEGELDGNQHYQDLGAATWEQVKRALKTEQRLLQSFATARDPEAAEAAFNEQRVLGDEEGALWWLDVGVAAPVLALNALGAHTVLSCNGGAFGNSHQRTYPSIRFYPGEARLEDLLELASEAAIGLTAEDGRGLLYAHDLKALQRFASLALERFQPMSALRSWQS